MQHWPDTSRQPNRNEEPQINNAQQNALAKAQWEANRRAKLARRRKPCLANYGIGTNDAGGRWFLNSLGQAEPLGGTRIQVKIAYTQGRLSFINGNSWRKPMKPEWWARQPDASAAKVNVIYQQPDRTPIDALAALTVPGTEPEDIRELRTLEKL